MENPKAEPQKACVPCRVVGGLGLVGAGAYVAYHGSKYPNKTARVFAFTVAGTLIGLGTARASDIPPFNEKKNSFTEPNKNS